MTRWFLTLCLLGTTYSISRGAEPPPTKPTPEQLEFFEKKVRPVLAEHCYSCHGPKKQNAGLRLDTASGFKQGADSGPIVVPGDPAKSRLVQSVKRVGDYPMPPKAPLPANAVDALTEWVKMGAPFPEDRGTQTTASDPRTHWAFQPVKDPPVPPGTTHPIDAYVAAKLREKGLTLAPTADRRTLIRRAYFDLIGLPPTPEEIDAFEKDTSPNAYEKVIDRLLASPHYGERWGRYWLDVARYADTKGYVFQEDRNFPYAYTYRDYVIRSFNEDKPYDRFVIEQIAADRLDLGADKRPLAAMGYLTLGRRFLNNQQDIIDDRMDTVVRGMLGLTVGCARCHDHKFDPVPMADYYSLYGVFASSIEPKDLPLIGEVQRTPELIAFETELTKQEAGYQAEVSKRHAATLKQLRSPDGVGDYLRAAIDSRGKTDDQLQAFLRERDLNRFVFDRWKRFLAVELKSHSPIYSPLVVLATIPEADFAAKAPGVIANLGKDPTKPINSLVLKALTDARPKSIKQAAAVIGGLAGAERPAGAVLPEQAELLRTQDEGGPLNIPVADADKIFNRADRNALTAIRKKIDAFKATNPAAPPRAHVLNDAPTPMQPVIFLRGNPGNRGPAVPRQFLAIAAGPNRKPFTDGSGRLELAKAIASAENPLTARVFANRVWIGHFGQGLVRTPSDFGVRTEAPPQPELLDWLAKRFMEDGWSIKKLHKRIMLSETYRQSSVASAEVYRLDPENKLLARQNRRRLDWESLRDSMLAASGRLDLTAGGKPVDIFKAPFSTRRSVYSLIDRSNLPGTLRVFDVASPDQHSPQRFQTTVPQQALFLMNSPFVAEQARFLAKRSEILNAGTAEERITRLYRLVFGRTPTDEERRLGREFVGSANPGSTEFGKWEQYAQVLLLSNEFAFVD